MVTANDDMFRPLPGRHQVVHLMKRGWGLYSCTAPTLFIVCTT